MPVERMTLIRQADLDGLTARKVYLEREIAFIEERTKDSVALERAAYNAKEVARLQKIVDACTCYAVKT